MAKDIQKQLETVIDEREMCYKDRARIYHRWVAATSLLKELRGMIKCDHEYSGECNGCAADEMINNFLATN